MKRSQLPPATLLLQDGTVFHGMGGGKKGTATGEICFNTGMTGYQEIFTDPSYYGQILVTTTSHIGNYGIHPEEVESSSIQVSGLVCKKFSDTFSRHSANGTIQDYFSSFDIPVLCDADTRSIVRHIRDKGAMNAVISSEYSDISELKKIVARIPSMQGLELSSNVTSKRQWSYGNQDAGLRVAVLDLGVKMNILRCLTDCGCFLHVFPMQTPFEEMMKINPDGFLLSNGPGDPAAMKDTIATVKKILAGNIPVFGICLGYQVLGLSCGLPTFKMHNGHRGVNHPVKNLITGLCEVTSQNHGFAVSLDDARKNPGIEITHIHLNDGTLAGFRLKNKSAFGVQYHPEASAGPHDSRYLFDRFIENMRFRKTGTQTISKTENNIRI
ncbi:MAG: glutamine-hydrolyzing carbamoyl-phosphate synthase small subunit [Bacteroidetes bacterium]|nr:glutamine-hydrolyzing carbamoyl-phosphate synthase small subunit [Bacteroidota bacterium]